MDDELKYFVQLIISKRQISETEARNYLSKLAPQYEFHQTMTDLNNRLQKLVNLKISKTICEISDTVFYCVIPTSYKKETFKPANFNDNELVFFKKIVLHLLESNSGSVRFEDLDEVREVCQLTRAGAESAIERLVELKYLMEVGEEYALTALCIAEFSTFLRLNFSDNLSFCKLCHTITIKGVRCPNCETPLHSHCQKMFFEKIKTPKMRKCPGCAEQWPTE